MKKISKIEVIDLLDPNELGLFLVKHVQQDLKALGLSDSNLIKNVDYRKVEKNKQWLVQVILPKYAINVDQGRRAGAKMPPVGPILDWLRRKKIAPKNGKLGQLAFAIAKSIAKKGIKARPFLKNIPEYTQQWIDFHIKEIVNILEQGVVLELREITKNNIFLKAK